MINYMPKAMRDRFAAEGREAGGWVYPKPTPALMAEGDCCITLHACPHGASMNVGPDPRMNMCAAPATRTVQLPAWHCERMLAHERTRRIFRIRRAREGDPNEGQEGHHGTDHPDRGRARFDEDGQPRAVFLDYPDGSAPAAYC